jgi:hypothetical protein
MNRSARRYSGLFFLALILPVLASAPVRAQESQSATLAKELVALLDQAKLDSIAARETQPDGYVAALYYPGMQLLVVAARYKEPVLLNERIAKKEYRETYIDLNSAGLPNTKCLVMDPGADGLKAKRDEGKAWDSFEGTGGKEIQFNGDWKAQKLSEDEYTKAFADADARYAKILRALIAQLKKPRT